ncbi:suppressor of fused domain protein [Millisia brevis]|uniref:suppressor of fused domain protein n=1 Tax=Millisia brevis TaxID=264148 RepID=UPI0008304ECC|nr:suppressor of fused domain protein [Millisia brevis]
MSADIVDRVRAHLTETFDVGAPASASVTFLGVEPIEIARFPADSDAIVRYATIGCSRHPMGDPTEMVVDPVAGPRAEVILAVRGGLASGGGVVRTLATFAAAPAVEGVVLRPDLLLDAGEPLWDGAPFTAVVLRAEAARDLPLDPPAEPVRFLRAVPITATEAAWLRLRGVDALVEAWTEAGIDLTDPTRAGVEL